MNEALCYTGALIRWEGLGETPGPQSRLLSGLAGPQLVGPPAAASPCWGPQRGPLITEPALESALSPVGGHQEPRRKLCVSTLVKVDETDFRIFLKKKPECLMSIICLMITPRLRSKSLGSNSKSGETCLICKHECLLGLCRDDFCHFSQCGCSWGSLSEMQTETNRGGFQAAGEEKAPWTWLMELCVPDRSSRKPLLAHLAGWQHSGYLLQAVIWANVSTYSGHFFPGFPSIPEKTW